MDPNSFFELTTRIRDKKTGLTIDLSLENLLRLITDVKVLLKIDNEVAGSYDLFSRGCTVVKGEGAIFRLEQTYGLASRRFILIHESSLGQLVQLTNIFLRKAATFDALANTYIRLTRKYVSKTRSLIDEGNESVKADRFIVLTQAISFENSESLDETEKHFVCETYANFQSFFVSFFED